ncbi:unnamed protein product [Clavelina lepadiformis]|uniref:Sushi domain-containing protein n=1 Tax=Clavelina lepadiformis TaxID=159417 RepID=A0ABP0GGM5_CLALP
MYVRTLTANSFLLWLSYVQGKVTGVNKVKKLLYKVSFTPPQYVGNVMQVAMINAEHRENWLFAQLTRIGTERISVNPILCIQSVVAVAMVTNAILKKCAAHQKSNCTLLWLQAVGAEKCESLPTSFQYGEIECTNSNFVDSKCTFSCTEAGYELQPSSSEQLTCLSSGNWNKPLPCCALPCPPYLPLDIVFLFHARSEKDITKLSIPYIKGRYRNFKAGLPNGFRFTAMFYGETIYEPVLLYEDTENITTAEEFLSKIRIYHNETGTAVNTGAALRYVYNNIFSKNDRPSVPKVLFLHTDENSADDVAAPAKALRDAGVLIYPRFIYVNSNVTINHEQLYEMAGVEGHVLVLRQPQEGRIMSSLYDTYLHRFCPTVCQTIA